MMVRFRFRDITLLMAVALLATAALADERVAVRDWKLACLASPASTGPVVSSPPWTEDRVVSVRLSISDSGAVTAVAPVHADDSLLVASCVDFCRGYRFTPAQYRGEPVASHLLGRLFLKNSTKRPVLVLPLDLDGRMHDPELYSASLNANKAAPPQIVRFPSIFARLKKGHMYSASPYLLAAVVIDIDGRPSSISEVSTSYSEFADQALRALNWGEYRPATQDGRRVVDTLFVIVSYFPDTQYPTPPWRREQVDSLPILERQRVRTIRDASGLMTAPVPRNLMQGVAVVGDAAGKRVGREVLMVTIGADGRPRTPDAYSKTSGWSIDTRAVMDDLRFFPAMLTTGDPVEYRGLIEMEYTGSTIIRIVCHWLQKP